MKHRPWLEKHKDQLNIVQRIIRPLVSKPAKNSLDCHEEIISSFGMRRFVKHREYSFSRIGLTLGVILLSLSVLSSDIREKISSVFSGIRSNSPAPITAPVEINTVQTQSQPELEMEDHAVHSASLSLAPGDSIWGTVQTYLKQRGLDASDKRVQELVGVFVETCGVDPHRLPPGWSFMIEELPDGTVILSQN